MFDLPRFASRVLGSRWRPSRRCLLRLEELESRALMSASGLDATIAPLDLHVTPLAGPGGLSYFTPAQVRHAYGFDKLPYDGSGQTIAIVDAYDDPTIANDLKTFDRQFGLPDPTFTKVKIGSPAADSGWAGEIALDVEWAHAIAPKANILLLEASSSSTSSLLSAVDYARKQSGVVSVSMSWGGGEFSSEGSYDSYFTTPSGHVGGSQLPGGITFVASSGDGGAGALWPAASPNVLAVGGTVLSTDSTGTYVGESGWSGSGGGVSAVEREPSWQQEVQTLGKRTAPDVAYDASPSSGFLVYNGTPNQYGQTGWFDIGGTSAGAPQWAALVALADQGRALGGQGSLGNAQSALYGLPASDFHDVTTGSNGYSAQTGYDLVTGLGSPHADLVVPALIGGSSGSSVTSTGSTGSNGGTASTAMRRADEGGSVGSGDGATFAPAVQAGPVAETLTGAAVGSVLGATDAVWQDGSLLWSGLDAVRARATSRGWLVTDEGLHHAGADAQDEALAGLDVFADGVLGR